MFGGEGSTHNWTGESGSWTELRTRQLRAQPDGRGHLPIFVKRRAFNFLLCWKLFVFTENKPSGCDRFTFYSPNDVFHFTFAITFPHSGASSLKKKNEKKPPKNRKRKTAKFRSIDLKSCSCFKLIWTLVVQLHGHTSAKKLRCLAPLSFCLPCVFNLFVPFLPKWPIPRWCSWIIECNLYMTEARPFVHARLERSKVHCLSCVVSVRTNMAKIKCRQWWLKVGHKLREKRDRDIKRDIKHKIFENGSAEVVRPEKFVSCAKLSSLDPGSLVHRWAAFVHDNFCADFCQLLLQSPTRVFPEGTFICIKELSRVMQILELPADTFRRTQTDTSNNVHTPIRSIHHKPSTPEMIKGRNLYCAFKIGVTGAH